MNCAPPTPFCSGQGRNERIVGRSHMPAARNGMAFLTAALVAASWLCAPATARAATVDGLFISVPNPIDSEAVRLIKRKIEDAIQTKKRNIEVVVFDFNPFGLPAGTSEWNSGNALAEFILDLGHGRDP